MSLRNRRDFNALRTNGGTDQPIGYQANAMENEKIPLFMRVSERFRPAPIGGGRGQLRGCVSYKQLSDRMQWKGSVVSNKF